jgi:beta-glucosidase
MESTVSELRRRFPPGFVWGAAVSAYQIEGAVAEDGRGESIWDRFSATPGKVVNADSGAVACDSYHRYRDDVRLMQELGLGAYRFSISWPRIVPEGRGRVNRAGLDYYERLVDELLAAGIEPFVTLYHWDLPQALEDQGGWPVRATAEAFAEYVEVVTERLGDRVSNWITQCEPWVVGWLGYGTGEHAPGRKSDADALAAAHHVLLSHGLAADVIRREAGGARVGITIDLVAFHPLTDSPEDRAAVVRSDGSRNRWILDPVLRGAYPEDMLDHFGPVLPDIEDGDLETIAAPLDFLGVNYYTRSVVRADSDGGSPVTVDGDGVERTDMGWEVYPDGLRELLVRISRDYEPCAIYVTENGAAFPDVRVHDGRVHDPERTAYLSSYIDAVARAVADGAPVKGYFVWSMLDNFEWAQGYSKRFGLVYIDYPTLERVPKDSFYWYRDLLASRRDAPRPSPIAAA